jgi:hypothetical protein
MKIIYIELQLRRENINSPLETIGEKKNQGGF